MLQHRLAANVGKHLAGKARGSQPSWDGNKSLSD
jgi:hypothetical protein